MERKDITHEDLLNHQRETTVERLRRRFPKGTRVVLIEMEDPQAPPTGTKGTVQFVDDAMNINVAWDTGSHLNLIYGVDRFSKLTHEMD